MTPSLPQYATVHADASKKALREAPHLSPLGALTRSRKKLEAYSESFYDIVPL